MRNVFKENTGRSAYLLDALVIYVILYRLES